MLFICVFDLGFSQCLSGDCKNGKGVYLYNDKSKYVGEFKQSIPHGYGIKTYKNNIARSGLWEKGRFVKSENLKVVEKRIEDSLIVEKINLFKNKDVKLDGRYVFIPIVLLSLIIIFFARKHVNKIDVLEGDRQSEYREIKKRIARDKILPAIEELHLYAKSKEQENEIILLKSRFESLKNQLRLGVVSRQDYEARINELKLSILYVLEKIETEGINNS